MNDAFHKRQIHGFVIVGKIYPAADPLEHIDPDVGIFQYVLTAEIVEFFNPELFDLFAAGNAELLFRRHFGRQAVAVPAQAAFNLFAAHGLKTGDHVFDIRHHDVPVVRGAVGKRRSVIKNELGRAVAVMNRFFKSFVFFPEFENAFLQFGKIRFCLLFSIMFRH